MQRLDEKVFVSGQIDPSDVPALKERGIAMIVNNRPDGEDPAQPLGADIEKAAERAGIGYRHVPIVRGIGPADVEAVRDALAEADGLVLLCCRSGTRSTLAWALARREEGAPLEEIERAAQAAGVSLAPIAHLL